MADPNQIEQQILLNKLLEKANKLGEDYSSILNSQHDVMSSMFEINSSSTDNHATSVTNLQNALDSLAKSQKDNSKSSDDQDKALKAITGSATVATGVIGKLQSKLQLLVGASVFINTLAKTFKLLQVSVTSVASVLATAAGSVFRLGLSLLTLPIGIINDLFAEAQQGGGSNEFRQTLEDIRKQFGDLSRNESKAIIGSFRSIRGELANTGLSSYRVLGNMAERLRFVFETAKNLGVAFSLLRTQIVQNAESVAAYIKGLGLTEEGQRALANRAVATGTSITEIGREMTTYAYRVGEAFGFNGKQISRDVGNMIGDIDNFGNQSIQTLTNVAVYARRLGVEVKALTKVIGAFDNFDKAAESVAQLSQAFGLQLDTFSLVQEQDPAARIEQLRKSFFAAGRSIESMTRQERSLLATHTGLDQETLALVFSQKSQATSYADIQRKSEQARKQQLTQAEAMQKLSNSIERLVKSGQALQGGLFDILFAGFAAGIRRSAPFRHLMHEIRQLMREVFRVGREMGRMFVDLFPGVKQLFTSLATYLSPGGIGKNFQRLKAQFKEFLTGLTPQNAGKKIADFVQGIRENFFGALQGPGLAQLRQALTTMGTVVMSLVAGMVRFVARGVADAFTQAAAFIRNPTEFLNNLREGAGVAGDGLMSAFAPLIDALVEMAPVVWNAFKDLLSAAFDRLKTWVIGFAQEHWMAIVGVLFAPALISSALSSIAGLVTNAVIGGAGGLLTRALGGVASLLGGGGAGGIGSALAGVSEAASGAGGLGEAVSNSPGLTNPASVAKLVVAAAVIGVGVYALVRGIVGLAKEIKANNLSASDIGIATLTMGAAVAIALAIAAGIGPITAAGQVVQSNLAKAAIGMAAIVVVAGALALGMSKLLTLFSGVSIAQLQVASVAMVAAVGVAAIVGLAAAGLAVGGALIAGPQALAIGAGLLAVGVVGGALAAGMLGLVMLFQGVSVANVIKTGTIMTTALQVVASIAASTAILAGVGALSALAPVVGVGMLAVVAIANGLKLAVGAIVKALERVNLGGLTSASGKITVIGSIITTLANVGVVLAAAAAPLAIAAGLGTITSNAIKKIGDNLFDSVSGLIRNAASLPNGGEMQAKIGIFTTIVRTIIDFGNTIRGLLSTGSVFEGVGNRVRAINSLIRTITGQIGSAVTFFIQQAGTINVGAIQPKLAVITSIISAIGTFSRGVLNVGNRDEDAIDAMRSYAAVVFNSITSFARVAMPKIGELVTTIASSSALTNVNVDVIHAFGEIISGVFGSIGSVIRSLGNIFTRQAGVLQDSDDVATAAPAMGQAIGNLISGLFGNRNLFESINTFVSGLASSLGTIAPDEVEKVKAVGSILGPLFQAIGAVAFAAASIGQQAVRGDAGAFDRLHETISAIAGGISTEFSGLITTLITSLGSIDPNAIRVVQSSSTLLSGLFENITQMFSSISSFGNENGGRSAAAATQNAFGNIYEAIFGTAGNAWSLKAFIDVFGPNRGDSAALMAALTSNGGTITAIGQKLTVFKQDITTIFGVVDSQFTSSLQRGLGSTIQHVNSTIQEIISNINEVHEQINQVGRSININAALANLGNTIGTANPERLQIARGDLTINISVHVIMDVDDIEEAIATRSGDSSFVINKEAAGRGRPYLLGAGPTN